MSRKKINEKACVNSSLIPLKEWQKKVVNYMNENDALLVVHSTGLGKTLTSIAVSQCFLDEDENNSIIFVGPAGLISNFKNQMKKFGVENEDRYMFYSFDKFFRGEKGDTPAACNENTMLIIDEAHNLRNPETKIIKSNVEKLTRSNAILNCAMNSGKRLLLSATPFVNSIDDFIPLINMIYGARLLGTKKQVKYGFVKDVLDFDLLKVFLKNKIDVVTTQDEVNFPQKFLYYVNVPMSVKYYKRYKEVITKTNKDIEEKLFDNPRTFYNGLRRAVNIAGSEYFSGKISKIVPIIKKEKSVIFTNWIEFGVKPIEKTLMEFGVSFNKITGDTDKRDVQYIVDDFNDGEFQVLIITKAGSEGLDLKEVRNLVVLDPVWNYAGLEQIIGRVVRYQSHINLKPSQRNVNVFLLVSTEPGIDRWDIREGEISSSGDRLLYDLIKKKQIMNEKIMETLKNKCSI